MLLSVGHLVPVKGFDRLIDAMALVDARDLALYIVGEGPERPQLAARIRARGLDDRVFLPGARSHAALADWYSAADLFCLASHREGCPNVILEAMACGAPVLAADVGGIAEILPADCGRVLAISSPDLLAAAITRALDESRDRAAIARRAAARAWTQVAAEVLEYYSRRGLR